MLIIIFSLVATNAREVVNFDFAWRHRLGDPARACGLIEPGVNYGDGGEAGR